MFLALKKKFSSGNDRTPMEVRRRVFVVAAAAAAEATVGVVGSVVVAAMAIVEGRGGVMRRVGEMTFVRTTQFFVVGTVQRRIVVGSFLVPTSSLQNVSSFFVQECFFARFSGMFST